MPKGVKRTREESDIDIEDSMAWKRLFGALKKSKADYLVEYYMEPPAGGILNQGDRDFVAKVTAYYSIRTKRDVCPPVGTVTASLPDDVQGYTTNRTPLTPIGVLFMTTKHINAMYHYLQVTRGAQHNAIVNIRVDGSTYVQIK